MSAVLLVELLRLRRQNDQLLASNLALSERVADAERRAERAEARAASQQRQVLDCECAR